LRRFLAGDEEVQGTGKGVDKNRPEDEKNGGVKQGLFIRQAQIAHDPVEGPLELHMVADGEDEEDEGVEKGVDHDAGQKQGVGFPAFFPAGDAEDDQDRRQGAEKGQTGNAQAPGARPQENSHDGPHRGTSGYSEDIGVRQGISQQGLKHHARHG